MTVLRGHATFHVKVDKARVKDSRFAAELIRLVKLHVHEEYPFGKSLDDILDLVYQQCLPVFKRLAPQTSLQNLILGSFLHSPTYNLEIVDAGASQDEDVRIEGEDSGLYTPSFFTEPMPTADLPASCRTTPHFHASSIQIASIRSEEGKSVDAIQGRVITSDGATMYFKPRQDGRAREFERELQVLSRIEETGLRLRVPTLLGIVVAGEKGETTMGILLNFIPSNPEIGAHLRSRGILDHSELYGKWEEQVTSIVRELHAHGIVWGDINPMNVVIDDEMNAWAVDFGGMNNAEFVDEENCETVEGDLQGVRRLFQEWLPQRLELYKQGSYPHFEGRVPRLF
jgi:tRNA A-37 threonylcarbamoyl transferase component Bud32